MDELLLKDSLINVLRNWLCAFSIDDVLIVNVMFGWMHRVGPTLVKQCCTDRGVTSAFRLVPCFACFCCWNEYVTSCPGYWITFGFHTCYSNPLTFSCDYFHCDAGQSWLVWTSNLVIIRFSCWVLTANNNTQPFITINTVLLHASYLYKLMYLPSYHFRNISFRCFGILPNACENLGCFVL